MAHLDPVSSQLEEVHVRCTPADEIVQVSLMLGGQLHTLNRNRDESLQQTLKRLDLTIQKKLKKIDKGDKKGKKKPKLGTEEHQGASPPAAPDTLALLDPRTLEPLEVSGLDNGTGWEKCCGEHGAVLQGPGGIKLPVVFNPPAVRELECSVTTPMVGYPAFPRLDVEFSSHTLWEWCRDSGAGSREPTGVPVGPLADAIPEAPSSRSALTVVSTERMYTPTAADLGGKLRVRCTPVRELGGEDGGRITGRTVTHFLLEPVKQGPVPGLLELRGHLSQVPTDPPSLRVVCYNILADKYCMSEQADTLLYPHVPRQFRQTDYRAQLVLRELVGYHADIICLQECDAKVFERTLDPVLSHLGYRGMYRNKAGNVPEGGATFWNSRRLELESSHDFDLKAAAPQVAQFAGLYAALPHLRKILSDRLTTTAQLSVLRIIGDPSRRLILANTHLFFHPHAAHIRLIQLVTLTARILELRKELLECGLRPCVMLCGDLNSVPWGPVRYLLGDDIPPQHELWNNLGSFTWGNNFFDEEELAVPSGIASQPETALPQQGSAATPFVWDPLKHQEGEAKVQQQEDLAMLSEARQKLPHLKLGMSFTSACGDPGFTNFTPTFTETLDYVLVESGEFEVERSLPFPEEEALRVVTPGLPSEFYPSDHVSLVADVKLRTAV